jgi:hypothetical protein
VPVHTKFLWDDVLKVPVHEFGYLTLATVGSSSVGALWRKTDTGPLAGAGMPGSGLLKRQLLGNRREQLPHVLGCLRRSLEEQEASLLRVSLGIRGRDGALVGLFCDEIELVSGEGDDDVLVRLPLQLLDPRLGLVKGGLSQHTVSSHVLHTVGGSLGYVLLV